MTDQDIPPLYRKGQYLAILGDTNEYWLGQITQEPTSTSGEIKVYVPERNVTWLIYPDTIGDVKGPFTSRVRAQHEVNLGNAQQERYYLEAEENEAECPEETS